jgi:hypothetical protein
MPKVTVMHAYYDCDTGCCGHVIEVDGKCVGQFNFDHPYEEDDAKIRQWAERFIRKEMGEQHVADLDWEHCEVSND